MRAVLLGLALCVTCLAEPALDVKVDVPPSAAHPNDWLYPLIRENPKPDFRGKFGGTLAEFVALEVMLQNRRRSIRGSP
jgi:hypothetical protein